MPDFKFHGWLYHAFIRIYILGYNALGLVFGLHGLAVPGS